jgi:hypothetical protein
MCVQKHANSPPFYTYIAIDRDNVSMICFQDFSSGKSQFLRKQYFKMIFGTLGSDRLICIFSSLFLLIQKINAAPSVPY